MNRPRTILVSLAVLHTLCFFLMLARIEPFYTLFYSLAWWSYIFVIAAFNQFRHRNSVLLNRPDGGIPLIWWSALFWFLFEAYNFRLANWSYLGVPIEPYIRWPGYFLAFGTVLPGVLETARLIKNSHLLERVEGPRLLVTPALLKRLVLIGILMMVAPVISPKIFFPLVWVGLILILDPLVHLWGKSGDSIVGQAGHGRYEKVIELGAAGIFCGFLWEFWNYWAGSKWVYEVPYLGFWRIFEMPLPGYLGFAFFAVECHLFERTISLIRQHWLKGHPVRHLLILIVTALFAVAVIGQIDERTVATYKLLFDS